MNIETVQFKRDPVLLGFALVLIVVAASLVYVHVITWKEATAFLMGALALPGLFGSSKDGA